MSLAILVDMSGSMRTVRRSRWRGGPSARFSISCGRAKTRSRFSRSTRRCTSVTTSRPSPADLYGALADFEPFGSTSLYDATAEAARLLAVRSAAHKAIIVLTDGTDTSSTLTAPQVSGLASSIAVPVFVVATVPSVDQRVMMETAARSLESDAADLRDLAEWTGGQLVFASTFLETVASASTLIDELRQRYVLAIEAAAVQEWRRLDVRVKRPSAKVKARSGYFGG